MAEHWEYLARNLKKVAGPALENDFNKLGAEGWDFVAVRRTTRSSSAEHVAASRSFPSRAASSA